MPRRAIHRITLLLLLLSVLATPAAALTGPTLRIWSANTMGQADLLPGDSVQVMIELRSDLPLSGTIQHTPPTGLVLESATANAGTLTTSPSIFWAGQVSSSQPITIVISYRVQPDAPPGDRTLAAEAHIKEQTIQAFSVLRVCCVAYLARISR